jgi:hypothetical protein
MAENKEEFELPSELIESIAGLNELIGQKQNQAAAMMYRLMFRHERNVRVLDRYSDVVLEGVSGMGSEFAKEDYRNFLQYLSYVIPSEYAPHKEMYEEELRIAEDDDEFADKEAT